MAKVHRRNKPLNRHRRSTPPKQKSQTFFTGGRCRA